jgi:hypothetical protein
VPKKATKTNSKPTAPEPASYVQKSDISVDVIDTGGNLLTGYVSSALENTSLGEHIISNTNSIPPNQVAESLLDIQKRNQLIAEELINKVEYSSILKRTSALDKSIDNIESEIRVIDGLIEPLMYQLKQNPNTPAVEVLMLYRQLIELRDVAEQSLQRKVDQRNKETDKIYKMRQSTREPTINIANFNLDKTKNLFEKFKLKKDG